MRQLVLFLFCVMGICAITAAQQQPPSHEKKLDSLARAALHQSLYQQAIEHRTEYIRAVEQRIGKNDTTYTQALRYLGDIYYDSENYHKALEYYRRATEHCAAVLGKENALYAKLLAEQGYCYRSLDQRKEGMQLLQQALAIQAKTIGINHADYAHSLHAIAGIHADDGHFHEAELLLLDALRIRTKVLGRKSLECSQSLQLLSYVYRQLNHYPQAEAHLLEAKQIREELQGNTHPKYAHVLSSLGNFYRYIGQPDKAEPILLEAQSIQEKHFGKEHPKYAQVINNLAMVYADLDHYHKAEPLYHEAGRILKQHYGEEHADYAQNRHVLALLYWQTDRLHQAKATYQRVLPIQKKVLGHQHFLYGLSLNNLAGIHLDLDDLQGAEDIYWEAYDIWKSTYGKEHPDCSMALNNLATVYFFKEDYQKALMFNLLSFDANSPDIDSTAQFSEEFILKLAHNRYYASKRTQASIQNLLRILDALYTQSQDISYLRRAYQVCNAVVAFDEQVRREFSSEGDKLRLLERNAHFLEQGMGMAYQLGKLEKDANLYIDAMFDFAEKNKSALLADALQAQHAHHFGDLPDSIRIKERKLQHKESSYKKALLESSDNQEKAVLQAKINDLDIEIQQFKKMIETQYPRYHQLKYQVNTTEIPDIQRLLSPNTALLEYFIADTLVYVFCLTQSTARVLALDTDLEQLDSFVAIFRQSLSDYEYIVNQPDSAYDAYINSALWFYDELLKAPLQGLSGINHLLIVPDGVLGHLPFEAFLSQPSPPHTPYHKLPYLLRNYSVTYSFSTGLWAENRQKPVSRYQSMLAMAAAYPPDAAANPYRSFTLRNIRSSLADIPEVQHEVQALSRFLDGRFLYKEQATEANFKAVANEHGVLHFAMHGLLSRKTPLLSGLAFTESSDTVEDNFLQAWEISQMELSASLVVLSACETGYGKFQQGEGVMSLGRAFMYAGVPSLLVSLWSVNDNSTALIMEYFYNNLADNQSKHEALRDAKLQYLAQAKGREAHPAYWSPFIQIGDERAIALRRKNNYLPVFVMLGIFSAFIGLLMLIHRWRMKRVDFLKKKS